MHGTAPSYQSARGVDHAQATIIPLDMASGLPLELDCDGGFTRSLGALK